MNFQSYQPGLPLAEFIETIWSIKHSGLPSSRQRVFPGGAMELVIHLADRTLSFFDGPTRHTIRSPLLAGPYSKSFLVDPSEMSAVLGVRFQPGAARLFFPIRADELHNLDIALDDLFPSEAARLIDQLSSARGFTAQCRLLERYLSNNLRNATPLHPAVRHAVHELVRNPGVRAISELQSETGLSHTRFIQLFRETVGLTPKLFCRVRRFRSVLQRVQKGLPVRWADLAAECGYFDQAHLIRDFRTFSGVTPAEFVQIFESSAKAAVRARAAS